MKKIAALLLTIGLTITAFSQNRAPSLWLRPKESNNGDIIMNDVMVPKAGSTLYTYYSVLNWNAGADGGGYCGIQNHPDGRNIIFSIWDPSNKQKIVATTVSNGTKVENFGGEGTGLKSWNFTLSWKDDEWYTLVSRRWDSNGHTLFGFWIHYQTNNIWYHLVTMDFPMANIIFKPSNGAFIEDWMGNGQNMRKSFNKNGYKRTTAGKWVPFTTVNFSANLEAATSNWNKNYDAGVSNNAFYMQSGGSATTPSTGSTNTFSITLPAEPAKPVIDFNITAATPQKVSWTVPASSTPQFKYTIKINGAVVTSAIDLAARSATINAKAGSVLELTLEDILGRTLSKSITIVVSGIESEQAGIENWTLAPNPFKDQFTIIHSGSYSVQVFSTLGQLMLNQEADQNISIQAAHWPSGLYMVKVLQNKNSYSFKLLKE
jgi:hypothetical protein